MPSQRDGDAPYDFAELAESIRAVNPKDVEEIISASALKELGRNAEANAGGIGSLLYSLGTPLEIDTLLQRRPGAGTPVNILYLNTLPNENLKQVFIQQLCRKLYDWLLINKSGEDLQCVLLLDEARDYLPSGTKNPLRKTHSTCYCCAAGDLVWGSLSPARALESLTTNPSARPIPRS